MHIKFKITLYLFASFICATHNAKILGVFIIPSISHQIVFQPIWRELSLRGHEVTVITPNPLRDPTLVNLTEIDIGFAREMFYNMCKPYFDSTKMSPWLMALFLYPSVSQLIQTELDHPPVKNLINDKTKVFDLVLIEVLHPLMYAFGGRFNCPIIGLSSHYVNLNAHFAMGNPRHPIAAPEIQLFYTEDLNLLERVQSVFYSVLWRWFYKLFVLPSGDVLAKKYFGQNIGSLSNLEQNLSLLLINTHPLLHGIRPNVPTVIELGHIPKLNNNQTLPKKLQLFLDSAHNGVIYFSLGSLLNSSIILHDKLDFIKEVFAELPQKVLWKWDDAVLPSQPQNVMIKKWVPQMEVLKHPNVKLFITHGGPQSIEEALTACVPILTMPVQFDQFATSKRAVGFGIGRMLDIDNFNKESFKDALIDIIRNPRYKEKVKELQALFDDQPMDGLQKAIWWIEYVIRHKGASHLRSPEIDIPFYQYYMIDLLVVVSSFSLVICYLLYKIVFLLGCLQRKLKKN